MKFQELQLAGAVTQNYANILELLLRLRQACDHPLLTLNAASSKRNGTGAGSRSDGGGAVHAVGSNGSAAAGESGGVRIFSDIEELVTKFMAESSGEAESMSGVFVEKVRRDLHAFAKARTCRLLLLALIYFNSAGH